METVGCGDGTTVCGVKIQCGVMKERLIKARFEAWAVRGVVTKGWSTPAVNEQTNKTMGRRRSQEMRSGAPPRRLDSVQVPASANSEM